jgi:hypothetical protein
MRDCPTCRELAIVVSRATDVATCIRTMGRDAEINLIEQRRAWFFHGLEHVKTAGRLVGQKNFSGAPRR